MPEYTDQMGRTIQLPAAPQRIISLVPSQTEYLHDLGLGDRVVGITKFCVHPEEWFRSKTRVGGTKQYDVEKIRNLDPDLIIGNKEENDQEEISALMREFPVWMSDIFNLEDAMKMMAMTGALCDMNDEATNIRLRVAAAFRALRPGRPKRVAYLIWKNPYMVAGDNTFINDMLKRCGFENVCPPGTRYPELSPAQLRDLDPELLLLSSEPYPFSEKHIEEFKTVCPDAQVMIVDGEMFSWYGSRLLEAPGYFQGLIQSFV